MRGLAALTVVIGHCSNMIHYNRFIELSPLYLFKAAHEAVIFFFLLSGYVLVYQYESKSKFKYGEFLILRICRIYLPYLASMIFTLICFISLESRSITFSFFGSLWQSPLNMDIIVNHILLINNFNTNSFNPVIWSLVHEMRIAIVFPVLLLIIRLKSSVAIVIGLVIFFVSATLIVININPSNGYCNGYFYTSYYFFIFMLGGIIVKNQSSLLLKYNNLSKGQQWLLTITAMIVYIYAHTAPIIFKKLDISVLTHVSFVFEDLLTTSAAFCFIIIVLQIAQKTTFLDGKIPLFFGRISFSLYLIHVPIIAAIYAVLNGKVSISAIILFAIVISVIISKIFNLYIERNATKIGKKITLKLYGSRML